MGAGVLLAHVVRVVGRDRRDAEVLAQPQQVVAHPGLDGEAVVHQLEEVVVLAQDVLEVRRGLAGLVVVTDPQPGLHLARGAPGRADDALAVLGEQLAVDAGLVEEAVDVGLRGQPEQVVHALGGLGEQGHVGVGARARDVVVAAVVPAHPLALVARGVGGGVGLHPDDRTQAVGLGLGPEVVGAEDVAVVGHGDRVHAQLGGALHHVGEPRRTVQHGVLGVDVQVGEPVLTSGCARHGARSALPGALSGPVFSTGAAGPGRGGGAWSCGEEGSDYVSMTPAPDRTRARPRAASEAAPRLSAWPRDARRPPPRRCRPRRR